MQAEASHFEPQLVLFYGVSINYYTNVQTKNRHTFFKHLFYWEIHVILQ